MTRLHFHPIAGRALSIIGAILHTPEVVEAGGALGPIHLVIEELVVNVTDYAYPSVPSDSKSLVEDYLDVETLLHDEKLMLRFRDGGLPFNPLEQASPDLSLPLAQRKKGGLGIWLVMKETDDVAYEYTSGENVLTVRFDISNKLK